VLDDIVEAASIFRVLLETAGDQARETRRQPGRGRVAPARERSRLLLENRRHRFRGGVALERAAAREHLVQHGPEGEDVGTRVGRVAAHLLRRHVAHGAEHRAGVRGPHQGRRVRVVGSPARSGVVPGEAEVEDLDPAVAGHEQVLGLEVAVDHALGVRGRQSVRELPRVVDRLSKRQRPAREPLAQRLALEQLHHGERHRALAPEVVDREDARVRERRDRLRLALEAGERLGGLREVRREHLYCHVAVELGVARPVHFAHPAGAEGSLDPVRPESIARREAQPLLSLQERCGILDQAPRDVGRSR
jgi:hypothetical protein